MTSDLFTHQTRSHAKQSGGLPLVAFFVLLAAIAGLGCSSESSSCSCAVPGKMLQAQPGTVEAIKLSGAACTGAQAQCFGMASTPFVPGCAEYLVTAGRPGDCQILVDFADGRTFETTVSMVQGTGCCAGIYPANYDYGNLVLPVAGDGGGNAEASE
jgi:hypothetical protein